MAIAKNKKSMNILFSLLLLATLGGGWYWMKKKKEEEKLAALKEGAGDTKLDCDCKWEFRDWLCKCKDGVLKPVLKLEEFQTEVARKVLRFQKAADGDAEWSWKQQILEEIEGKGLKRYVGLTEDQAFELEAASSLGTIYYSPDYDPNFIPLDLV
ncbi:MAG: hypothetical protein GY810_31720 [Aureispira sp.]|nr:hypothetical protein [Aureispira sp.]